MNKEAVKLLIYNMQADYSCRNLELNVKALYVDNKMRNKEKKELPYSILELSLLKC